MFRIDSGHRDSLDCAAKDTHKRGFAELLQKVADSGMSMRKDRGSVLREVNATCLSLQHLKINYSPYF